LVGTATPTRSVQVNFHNERNELVTIRCYGGQNLLHQSNRFDSSGGLVTTIMNGPIDLLEFWRPGLFGIWGTVHNGRHQLPNNFLMAQRNQGYDILDVYWH
jgi:hypothetical protein